jgi:hypothetical protein
MKLRRAEKIEGYIAYEGIVEAEFRVLRYLEAHMTVLV